MDLRQYYMKKVSISTSVQHDAEELIMKMKNNVIKMDVLPNSYDNYTGRLELDDYLSFCQFLESRRGKIILNLMEENIWMNI